MSGVDVVEKKKINSNPNRRRVRGEEEERRRRREGREREGRNIYVYAPQAREKHRSPRREEVRGEPCSGEEELSAVEEERDGERRDGSEGRERRSSGHRRRRRPVEEDGTARHRSSASLSRSKTSSHRKDSSQPLNFLRRSFSSASARPDTRPVIKRAHTTSNTHLPKKTYESTGPPQTPKRSIFLDMFTPGIKEEEPVKLVECLTCLSDDIPRRKSAKLKCGHRMCHSCLRRIFKLSVTDPQHMPPKCCTADCIPLKHVDKLFDIPFKKLWNRKFQEYTTKNRIYCPSRRCGEWIKPGNYHDDGKGGRYGKCGRCKTRVCVKCSGKWHGRRECAGDEETNRLLEAAKEAGWQRCYSCRTMVELKEGCNHMTCRCTAEFCMLCGLKWKTCACPWFNYDNIADNDRLGHMRIPMPHPPPQPPGAFPDPGVIHIPFPPPPQPRPPRLRRQNQDDLVRGMRGLDIDPAAPPAPPPPAPPVADWNFGFGVGNAAGHHMNETYRRPVPLPHQDVYVARGDAYSPPAPAPAPSPPTPAAQLAAHAAVSSQAATLAREREMRQESRRRKREVVEERARREEAERVAREERRRRRREREAAAAAAVAAEAEVRREAREKEGVRSSVMAGLGGRGRGSGRVGAWRTHVGLGVEPEEGVISVV
ncbi:hypothetical protein VE01_07600 [Pseudogymnoascus verrucosus]|uniref:RBR-type E3 ubiquitin transferase n=1 Tax=Pseudogymnoascus verrucosus TaxID=342668 RepID=A0A1B8GHB1_9PEZI|nr:uncharacterized protein VE01_07600 [Pseudogymnoascus verrucosus]OBT95237.1 hypothetical protein VE01_07600 [Pseudogymnoascus verrucosus]